MDIDNLGKIQSVEAPEFLFTRIQQKIENENKATLSKKMVLTTCFSLALLLLINLIAFTSMNTESNPTKNYAQSFYLISNNSLYP